MKSDEWECCLGLSYEWEAHRLSHCHLCALGLSNESRYGFTATKREAYLPLKILSRMPKKITELN